jgi:hypothetical protein
LPGRIFGPKRVEVAGGQRRMHNEKLHNLYASKVNVKVNLFLGFSFN